MLQKLPNCIPHPLKFWRLVPPPANKAPAPASSGCAGRIKTQAPAAPGGASQASMACDQSCCRSGGMESNGRIRPTRTPKVQRLCGKRAKRHAHHHSMSWHEYADPRKSHLVKGVSDLMSLGRVATCEWARCQLLQLPASATQSTPVLARPCTAR